MNKLLTFKLKKGFFIKQSVLYYRGGVQMPCIREELYEKERAVLAPNAALACNSKGRLTPEEESPIRAEYQRDRDRSSHRASFRRVKHKTQG